MDLGYVADGLIANGDLTGDEVTALKDPRAEKEKE